MQTRYLGDSHDFIKFALLRHVHRHCGLRLGVNWYLTSPDEVDRQGSSDGEMRHHLTHHAWRAWDPELLEAVRDFELPEGRTLAALRASGILPRNTLFFEQPVPHQNRANWHHHAVSALAAADLVFIDPDNGMEVKPKSMTGRRKSKYAYYSEMKSYFDENKAVMTIQFARQCDPIKRGRAVRDEIHRHLAPTADLPIVRGRVAPNILFLAAAPDDIARELEAALCSFGEAGPKVELIF